jgi:threonine dehydrogenase-like Zn-dependent dehydrogenase
MKTLRMLGDKKSEVVEVADLEPKDDHVVVKVMGSAVCGSEHPAYYTPSPLPDEYARDGGGGHEGAGLVWKVDKASRMKEGDHVTIAPMPKGAASACSVRAASPGIV